MSTPNPNNAFSMLDEDKIEDVIPKDNANTNGDTARIAASAWESLMLQVLASFMSADQHQALLASIQATPGQFQEGMAANAPTVNPVSLPGHVLHNRAHTQHQQAMPL